MGASIAHRHSNPTTDCSDQKRKIRERNTEAKGRGRGRHSIEPIKLAGATFSASYIEEKNRFILHFAPQ